MPDAERLLYLKDSLVTSFDQLPSEHQATIVMVLVGKVLDGELGDWFDQSYRLLHQTSDEQTQANLFDVTANHLEQLLNYDPDIHGTLTDEERAQVARQMQDHYTHALFWDELAFFAASVIADREQK